MRTTILSAAVFTVLAIGLGGCSAEPKDTEAKASLSSNAGAALDQFRSSDQTVQGTLDKSAGYAVFPNLGKAGLGVGGAYGRGEVYEGGKMIGYCDLVEGTVGAHAGVQAYSELIVFKEAAALDKFKSGEYAFAANASAVAIKQGAAKAATYRDGIAVFVHSKSGLMAEASVGGQKFRFKPL